MVFAHWCEGHLLSVAAAPPALSTISDLRSVANSEALEAFASELADLLIGPERGPIPGGALMSAVQVPSERLDDLAWEARSAPIRDALGAIARAAPVLGGSF